MSVEFVSRDEYVITSLVGAIENDLGYAVSFDLSVETTGDTQDDR